MTKEEKKAVATQVAKAETAAGGNKKVPPATPKTPNWEDWKQGAGSPRALAENQKVAMFAKAVEKLAYANKGKDTPYAPFERPTFKKGEKGTSFKYGSKINNLFRPTGKIDSKAVGYESVRDAMKSAVPSIKAEKWDDLVKAAFIAMMSWALPGGGKGGAPRKVNLGDLDF